MNLDFSAIAEYIPLILSGIPVILKLSAMSAIFGSLIGLVCAFIKIKKGFLSYFVSIYIDFFRGTPVYFQVYFFYFGVSQLVGRMNPWFAATLVFSLNSGAYLAEIMRAGIEGIDKGQIEAAKALGVKQSDIMKDIILPQAVRNVLPALINEFITLTKETSVVSVMGLSDMMRMFTIVSGATYRSFEPLLIVGVAYYLLNKVLSFIGSRIERKLKYD